MLFVPLSPLSALSAVVDWPGYPTTKEPRAAVEYTRTGWGS